jgi:hypothetical protein
MQLARQTSAKSSERDYRKVAYAEAGGNFHIPATELIKTSGKPRPLFLKMYARLSPLARNLLSREKSTVSYRRIGVQP